MDSIPLQEAVLCESCRVITRAKNGHCPVCESTALLNLAQVLDRKTEVSGVRMLKALADGSMGANIGKLIEEYNRGGN